MPSSFTGLLPPKTLTTTLTTLQHASKGKILTFGVLVLPSITGELGGGGAPHQLLPGCLTIGCQIGWWWWW